MEFIRNANVLYAHVLTCNAKYSTQNTVKEFEWAQDCAVKAFTISNEKNPHENYQKTRIRQKQQQTTNNNNDNKNLTAATNSRRPNIDKRSKDGHETAYIYDFLPAYKTLAATHTHTHKRVTCHNGWFACNSEENKERPHKNLVIFEVEVVVLLLLHTPYSHTRNPQYHNLYLPICLAHIILFCLFNCLFYRSTLVRILLLLWLLLWLYEAIQSFGNCC